MTLPAVHRIVQTVFIYATSAYGTMVVGGENTGQAMRRSTRVPAEIAMRVRSLDPGFRFEGECKTLLVNAQGCGFQCPRQLPVGIAVQFTIEGRHATATVLNATSLGEASGAWVIGAKMHQTGNFWGLSSPPADWEIAAVSAPTAGSGAAVEEYIVQRVTAEVQRQTEHAFATLRAEVEKLAADRESDLLSRMISESSSTAVEMVQRAAEQHAESLQQAFDTLSARFKAEMEHQMQTQVAIAEERLRSLQTQLSASGQTRFESVAAEIVEKIHQDAKQLSDSAIAQWHAAFEQTLQMLPDLVRQNLQQAGSDVRITRH